jgi:GNAT superfamily N-acetyltransferase
VRIVVDPFPGEAELDALMSLAWEGESAGGWANVLERSLVHVGAYEGDRLVGFVNVAWDGGAHAFLLDTTVAPAFQRAGLGQQIVGAAATAARTRGARWLHVDYKEKLTGFYAGCGFRPTAAGLIDLTGARE